MTFDKIKVLSSPYEFEKFKESIIWKDLRRELFAWKRGFELELRSLVDTSASTNPSTASLLMHLGEINGRIKAVEYILALPDLLSRIAESQRKDVEEPLTEPEESEDLEMDDEEPNELND